MSIEVKKSPRNCHFCGFSDRRGRCAILDFPDEMGIDTELQARINAVTEWVCDTGPNWSGVMPPPGLSYPPCPGFHPLP